MIVAVDNNFVISSNTYLPAQLPPVHSALAFQVLNRLFDPDPGRKFAERKILLPEWLAFTFYVFLLSFLSRYDLSCEMM